MGGRVILPPLTSVVVHAPVMEDCDSVTLRLFLLGCDLAGRCQTDSVNYSSCLSTQTPAVVS